MMRKDLLVRKTRELLGEFLAPMLDTVDKPRQRFLQQAIRGILFSGSLVVTDLCRWVRDDCSDRFYQVKRLLNHLDSPRGDLTEAVCQHRQAAAAFPPHPALPFTSCRLEPAGAAAVWRARPLPCRRKDRSEILLATRRKLSAPRRGD